MAFFMLQNKKVNWLIFASLIAVAIIGGVGAGFGYTNLKERAENKKIQEEQEKQRLIYERQQQIKKQNEELKITLDKQLKDRIFPQAKFVYLKDTNKGTSTGKFLMAVYQKKTYFRMEFSNLPKPWGSNFYEAWIKDVFTSNQPLSLGKVERKENGGGMIDFVLGGEKTGFRSVFLTLEPGDNNPKPAQHILEGSFSSKLKGDYFTVEL